MSNDNLGMLGSILAYRAFFAAIYVLFGIG